VDNKSTHTHCMTQLGVMVLFIISCHTAVLAWPGHFLIQNSI
jgi:hypothetical protein